jgi:hypothetical protein
VMTPGPDPRSVLRPDLGVAPRLDPLMAPGPDPRSVPRLDPRSDAATTPGAGPRTGRVAEGRNGFP